MAQVGFTPILIYSSTTASQAPAAGSLTNSTLGSELAINITDGKLFYKDNANAIQVIAWKVTPTTAGGTGLTSYTAGDMVYWASGTTFTKLAIGAAGYWMSSSGTAPQWNAPAALTKTDDTNVTLTLGGSASTALLNAASLTLGWTGQLAATRGGTGFGSYAVGDLLYANTTTTLAKLADVATGNALISGGVGVAPSWGKIGLTTHVSGTLPTANGGTNLTSFTANGVMYASSASALTTGSSLTFDGTNFSVSTSGNPTYVLKTSGAGNNPLYRIQADTNYWDMIGVFSDADDTYRIRYNNTDYFQINNTGEIKFTGGNITQGTAAKGINFTANTAASGMTSQLLNWYEEITAASTACTGAITTAASWTLTRVGNVVTLTLPPVTGAATSSVNFEFGVLIPSGYRPSSSLLFPCGVRDNDANQTTAGMVIITSAGNIRVYVNIAASANFTANASATAAGFAQGCGFSCSWRL